MNPEKFGDSYDFVKKKIIHGLAPANEWAVHPMYFSTPRKPSFVRRYANFLGIIRVNGPIYDRERLRTVGKGCARHLFLDPDTGLWVPGAGGVTNVNPPDGGIGHVTIEELVDIAMADGRQHSLTLVYDQSYSGHTPTKIEVRKKLVRLRRRGVYCTAYVSHEVFIWACRNKDTLIKATQRLREQVDIPFNRFVGIPRTGQ